MPKTAVTATVTTEVTIAPKVRAKLVQKFKQYAELSTQKKGLSTAMDKLKDEIANIRNETGEVSLHVDGFTTTLVGPTRKKFNEKKFVKLGGDLEIYRAAIEEKPSKTYEKITVPGDEEEGGEEE